MMSVNRKYGACPGFPTGCQGGPRKAERGAFSAIPRSNGAILLMRCSGLSGIPRRRGPTSGNMALVLNVRKLVHRTLAERPITSARKRKLTRVAAEADSQIDFSEIPPLTEKFWKNAVRNPFRRQAQQQLTVRLDADVVAWLQRQGEDYQSRLNGLLRKAMQDEIRR